MAKARQPIAAELLITPDPFTPKFQILIQRDSATGVTGIYCTEDGVNFRPLLPAPGSKDRIGSVATILDDNSVGWKLPSSASAAAATRSPDFPSFFVAGSLAVGLVGGYFKVPTGQSYSLTEVQLFVQSPADGIIRVDVINGSGVAQGRVATINADASQKTTVFSSPLKMAANTVWSPKILAAGSEDEPGENLTIRWVLGAG